MNLVLSRITQLIKNKYVLGLLIVGGLVYVYLTFFSIEGFKSDPSEKEIVLFKSEGCGYCKRIMPVWDKLTSDFRNNPFISFRVVDVAKDNDPLVQSLGIEGVPTIYFLKQETPMREYTGDRSYEDLKLFVEVSIQQ